MYVPKVRHAEGRVLGKEALGEHGRERPRRGVLATRVLLVDAPHRVNQPVRVHALQRCEGGGLKVRGEHHAVHARDRAVDRRQPVCRLLVRCTWCARVVPSTIVVLKDEGECGPLLERRVGGAPPGAFGLWGGVT